MRKPCLGEICIFAPLSVRVSIFNREQTDRAAHTTASLATCLEAEAAGASSLLRREHTFSPRSSLSASPALPPEVRGRQLDSSLVPVR